MIPLEKPASALFSSGPCAKRPGWTIENLKNASLGRSHRAVTGKNKLKSAIDLTGEILSVPEGYRIAIVPASDTGAVEMMLWNLLGERGVDMLAWESFGKGWITDVKQHLKLEDVRYFEAEYGKLPDLDQVDTDRDVVFTWNGTTSGVRVPNADWIKSDRKGLTICDATSAVFAQDLDFEKLDVVTFSWQKVMGGEAAHGMIILSPRAVERLENYVPKWPLPKIFRLTKKGKLIEGIFSGATINTPSMLCVEDYLDSLNWAQSIGGLKALMKICDDNLAVIKKWVSNSSWAEFLAVDDATISNTSVCLKITAHWFTSLDDDSQNKAAKRLASILASYDAAYDVGHYRDAPAGLRIWAGATIETSNMVLLMPWLDYAYKELEAEYI